MSPELKEGPKPELPCLPRIAVALAGLIGLGVTVRQLLKTRTN